MARADRWIGAAGIISLISLISPISLIWLVGVACAPRYPYTIAPGQEGAPGVQTVLLLPLNLAVGLPPELAPGADRVSAQIQAYLERRGKAVIAPGVYESRLEWGAAVARAQAEASDARFEAAARALVARLREKQPCDVIVMPSLVYREAQMAGGSRHAMWDGVKRKLHVVGEEHMRGDIYLMNSFFGKIAAVSLHLMVFDGRGEKVFERFGGLDLVHEADVSGMNEQRTLEMRLKSDVLGDTAALRQGILVAFHPYMPPASRTVAGGP